MEVYSDIKTYFLNAFDDITDYDNQFYIMPFGKDWIAHPDPDTKYYEPHKRDFFEIGIIAQHNKNMEIGEQVFDSMQNGLAIVSPFQTIKYGERASKLEDKDEGYVIYFKSTLLDRFNQPYEVQNEFPFFKMHTLPLYYLTELDFKELTVLAETLYQEAKANKVHSLDIIKALLLILLYKVKRITSNNEGIVTVNRYATIMSKFENAIQSSQNNFRSVNEYASQLNISPIYLTECVKKTTGKSAQKIIIDYKVLHAKTLLNKQNLTNAEIAEVLGFNEVANFNQFFKRNVGITATQFRKQTNI
ncbi:AraC family transcriptional regulator [Formosa sediminum]|uniref:AraC family transcriptional regulator n=1 Tax=Formosa sediminum TaxID=2594004 RepID=A0A516GSL3_9FLAO|nr:helix-turn-helix domain-containing protein [Formosa sediminum]QDO94517.1 AraC family transcriptional regulator [Formosa sediminum]